MTSLLFPGMLARAEASPISVELWFAGGKTAVDVLREIVDRFNQSQSEYHVNALSQADYDETYQKLQAAIAGGNAPDVVLLNNIAGLSLASKGLLADLNPLIDADPSFDRTDYIETFFDAGCFIDGTQFSIPAYGTTQVLYYNIELFEHAGIDPASIRTWQDLGEAARNITVKENGETVVYGWEPMYGVANLMDAVFSNGGKLFSDDMSTVLVNTPEWVEVWEQFRIWLHEEQTMRIHFGGQGWAYWYQTIDDVLRSVAGGYTGSSGDQADLDFSIVAAMEQPGWGSNPSAPMADALHLGSPVGTDADTLAGAYEFMKFFTDPEQQAYWSMNTGYVAVRKSTLEIPAFKAFAEAHPQVLVPIQQSMHGTVLQLDITGGVLLNALVIAADQVEIENIPAQVALDQAAAEAQMVLDAIIAGE
jgi:multiple sugar transport system substrate-binding protein